MQRGVGCDRTTNGLMKNRLRSNLKGNTSLACLKDPLYKDKSDLVHVRPSCWVLLSGAFHFSPLVPCSLKWGDTSLLPSLNYCFSVFLQSTKMRIILWVSCQPIIPSCYPSSSPALYYGSWLISFPAPCSPNTLHLVHTLPLQSWTLTPRGLLSTFKLPSQEAAP